jgi:hypothetical protein
LHWCKDRLPFLGGIGPHRWLRSLLATHSKPLVEFSLPSTLPLLDYGSPQGLKAADPIRFTSLLVRV